MADAAAAGRRVLLVCQKRAALDVVQARLHTVGMTPFMALIHDFQDDRRALYAQIASQIENIDAYRQQNNGLNAVLMERDFEQESNRIDDAVRWLQTFKSALFDTAIFGISAKELYLASRPDQAYIDLGPVAAQLQLTDVLTFSERLAQFVAYQEQLINAPSWSNRRSFANYSVADRPRIEQTIRQWSELSQSVQAELLTTTGLAFSRSELLVWSAYTTELTGTIAQLTAIQSASVWDIVGQLRTMHYQSDEWLGDSQLIELVQTWKLAEANALPNSIVALHNLPASRQLLLDAIQERPSWIRWQWWRLTNSAGKTIDELLSAAELTDSEAHLRLLLRQIDNAIRAGQIRQEVTPWLQRIGLPITTEAVWELVQARQLLASLDSILPLSTLPSKVDASAQQLATALRQLCALSIDVVRFEQTQTYLSDHQLDWLWTQPAQAGPLTISLRENFDLFVGADQLQAAFSPTEQSVVNKLNSYASHDWVMLFQNSIRMVWLDLLEQRYPELSSVSSLKMAQTEHVLQESLQRKQQLNRDMLLIKLREQTYRKLTFNRVSNVVTYRDLLHQTTKKRNVWPLRKLLETHAEEVFKLIPCWLASTESVSAIFPLRPDLFDLVIVDEASQCDAESGIPAFFRGRQIVVTGDSQQLRPSDVYRTQIDDLPDADEEIPAELEVESLLELATRYLPQVWLTEHYRSRSLDLIAFSNHHFYEDRLQLLPYFTQINRLAPAIQYVHVDGQWEHNTNRIEAAAVLDQLRQIAAEQPGRSVGVVTFNYPQQQFIQNLLDENPLPSQIPNLFVKNIENVQGDERDIIIFSVGYAPNKQGRLAMQFGSLNAVGGENRLNVAVTRARERVYVITSVWPEQLTVDNVSGDGPRRLRDYLTYALTVSERRFKPHPQPVTALRSSNLLKDRLLQQSPNYRQELPFADLTIRTGDTYQSLLLTDDDQFYDQPVKQSLAYLPMALRERGWLFKRVWSRNYWRNSAFSE
jgi:hypothetical protein